MDEATTADPATSTPAPPPQLQQGRQRRKRTVITAAARSQLEQLFSEVSGDGVGDIFTFPPQEQTPGSQEVTRVGRELGLAREVVRVWFCNRRQRQRRRGGDTGQACASHSI